MVKRQFETITSGFKRGRLNTWLLLMLGTAVLVVLIGWLGSWGFRVVQDWTHLQQSPTDATQKQFNASLEIVKAIVGGLGTLATIVGGIVLYLNFRVANKNAELTESRLITERFSKAVEQLGSDKIEVRLGGIYALERIAQDSVRDHWTIMEVLTAFVREKSPVKSVQKPQVKESFVEHHLQQQSETEVKLTPVTKDVQAALTVIGRREAKNDPEGKQLDLSNAKLHSTNLYCATLCNANFSGSNLEGADLSSDDPIKAFFRRDRRNANLCKTNLKGANLKGTNLEGANLEGGTDLSNANLEGVNLHKVNLWRADLSGATFSGANLRGAQLSDADLSGALLWYADLSGATFSGANLSGASFNRTILYCADLTNAKELTGEQLQSAKVCRTTLPDGTISDRDCEAMGLPPSTSSTSETEPDSH